MRGTWAKRIPPAVALGIALGIASPAAADSPAGRPSAPAVYGSPCRGAAASPAPPMLAVPPRRDDQVVPALWKEPAGVAKEIPHDSVYNPKPLPPPNQPVQTNPTASGKARPLKPAKKPGDLHSLISAAGGLGIVIGIFLLGAWLFRRSAPQGLTRLPGEVFEILGRAPLAGKQQVHLLRCGTKLLLVSVTPAGAETLTEITDPKEVDRLAGLCCQAHPQSSSAAFRQIFEQLAPHRAGRGLRDRHASDNVDLSGWGLDGGGPP
jgi:flagellar biogenesis protein FliO